MLQLPVLEHANAALCCVLFEQLDYGMNTFPGFHHLRQFHLRPNCFGVVIETILQPLDVVLQAGNVDCHPTSSDNPVDVVLRKQLRSHPFEQHVLNVLNRADGRCNTNPLQLMTFNPCQPSHFHSVTVLSGLVESTPKDRHRLCLPLLDIIGSGQG